MGMRDQADFDANGGFSIVSGQKEQKKERKSRKEQAIEDVNEMLGVGKNFKSIADSKYREGMLHYVAKMTGDMSIIKEVEDGGSGSGNWGHKGRPGIHGGSAKGGGNHWRGGQEHTYAGKRRGWGNGLYGEENARADKLITTWADKVGKLPVPRGAKLDERAGVAVMAYGTTADKQQFLYLKGKSHNWENDEFRDKLCQQNLSYEERTGMQFLFDTFAHGYAEQEETITGTTYDGVFYDTNTSEQIRDYYFALKNKALGGSTRPVQMPQNIAKIAGFTKIPSDAPFAKWASDISTPAVRAGLMAVYEKFPDKGDYSSWQKHVMERGSAEDVAALVRAEEVALHWDGVTKEAHDECDRIIKEQCDDFDRAVLGVIDSELTLQSLGKRITHEDDPKQNEQLGRVFLMSWKAHKMGMPMMSMMYEYAIGMIANDDIGTAAAGALRYGDKVVFAQDVLSKMKDGSTLTINGQRKFEIEAVMGEKGLRFFMSVDGKRSNKVGQTAKWVAESAMFYGRNGAEVSYSPTKPTATELIKACSDATRGKTGWEETEIGKAAIKAVEATQGGDRYVLRTFNKETGQLEHTTQIFKSFGTFTAYQDGKNITPYLGLSSDVSSAQQVASFIGMKLRTGETETSTTSLAQMKFKDTWAGHFAAASDSVIIPSRQKIEPMMAALAEMPEGARISVTCAGQDSVFKMGEGGHDYSITKQKDGFAISMQPVDSTDYKFEQMAGPDTLEKVIRDIAAGNSMVYDFEDHYLSDHPQDTVYPQEPEKPEQPEVPQKPVKIKKMHESDQPGQSYPLERGKKVRGVQGTTIKRGYEKTPSLAHIADAIAKKRTLTSSYIQEYSQEQLDKAAREATACFRSDMIAMSMRFPQRHLDSILKNGFLNQIELHDKYGRDLSEGLHNPRLRREASESLFGTKRSSNCQGYEKYGYAGYADFAKQVQDGSSDAENYGDVIVHFNKQDVFGRTTYTIGDSLGCYGLRGAGLIGTDGTTSYDGVPPKWSRAGGLILSGDQNDPTTMLKAGNRYQYMELQYHGELTPSNMSEICFTQGKPSLSPATKSALKKLGIPVYYIEYNGTQKEMSLD